MLDMQEICGYIAVLEAQKDHTVSEINLLSALYSIRDHCGKDENYLQAYSQASAPIAISAPKAETLGQYGDSDFLLVIAGKLPADAWAVMDDLMDTLQVANPRVYESIMRKLRQL